MKQMNTGRNSTKFLVELAVLTALELMLEMTGLGYIHTGTLEFTIMQVPVIVGAIVLGPTAGLILGSVFGLTSFWQCFGKSLFGTPLMSISPIATFVTCVVTRALMGLLCGLLFRWLGRQKKSVLRCGIAGLSGALLNTVLFMGALVALFGRSDYLLSMGSDNVLKFIVTMVGIQGVLEAVICCVVSASVSYALLKVRK